MTAAKDYKKRSFGVDEAAAFLGIAKGTLYNMVGLKQVPHYRIGRKVVFRENELNEYMERRAVEAINKVKDERRKA